MKKYQLLFLGVTVALLTACGSGGSGGSSSSTAGRNNLPYQYDVKPELKQAVRDSLKYKVDWEPVKGRKTLTIDGKSYNKGDFIYYTNFDLGYSKHDDFESRKGSHITKGEFRVYRQPYSLILAGIEKEVTPLKPSNTYEKYVDSYGAGLYAGYLTKDLPKTGSADYVGKSFYNEEIGNLKLSVNFGEKAVTRGEITDLSVGKVIFKPSNFEVIEYETLDDRDVPAMGFKGEISMADSNAKVIQKYTQSMDGQHIEFKEKALKASDYYIEYEGHFFGPNAEEVAGGISMYDKRANGTRRNWVVSPINFAGQRGKIKKP